MLEQNEAKFIQVSTRKSVSLQTKVAKLTRTLAEEKTKQASLKAKLKEKYDEIKSLKE